MGAVILILLWVWCVVKCINVWQAKGGSPWVGFWLGFIGGLFGLLIVHACQPSRR